MNPHTHTPNDGQQETKATTPTADRARAPPIRRDSPLWQQPPATATGGWGDDYRTTGMESAIADTPPTAAADSVEPPAPASVPARGAARIPEAPASTDDDGAAGGASALDLITATANDRPSLADAATRGTLIPVASSTTGRRLHTRTTTAGRPLGSPVPRNRGHATSSPRSPLDIRAFQGIQSALDALSLRHGVDGEAPEPWEVPGNLPFDSPMLDSYIRDDEVRVADYLAGKGVGPTADEIRSAARSRTAAAAAVPPLDPAPLVDVVDAVDDDEAPDGEESGLERARRARAGRRRAAELRGEEIAKANRELTRARAVAAKEKKVDGAVSEETEQHLHTLGMRIVRMSKMRQMRPRREGGECEGSEGEGGDGRG